MARLLYLVEQRAKVAVRRVHSHSLSEFRVTVTRSGVSAASECHLLSIVHRKTPVSATLTLKLDALAEHHEGLLFVVRVLCPDRR